MAARERRRLEAAGRRGLFRLAARHVDPRKLVFLDESGARTHMTRLYGGSAGKTRCVDHAPGGHWRSCAMLAAIRPSGVVRAASLLSAGAMEKAGRSSASGPGRGWPRRCGGATRP